MADKKTRKSAKQKKRHWIILGASSVVLILASIVVINQNNNSIIQQNNTSEKLKIEAAGLPRGELYFIDKKGNRKARLLIEIAEDDYSRSKGLMLRRDLAENQGMLFIFEREAPQAFWMKNTPLSLDMIFLNARKEIVQIHKYTKPFSTQTYYSGRPAQYVVETVAGFADRYEIEIGDLIEWKRKDNQE